MLRKQGEFVKLSAPSLPSLEGRFILPAGYYSQREIDDVALLAKLVYAESRGEPFEGQVAVAAVVLNRVKHPSFPNSVKEVIMEPGQFLSVDNGMIGLTPGDEARRAVDLALEWQDPSRGPLFFYNPRKSKALAWWQTRTTTAVIGDHNFAI